MLPQSKIFIMDDDNKYHGNYDNKNNNKIIFTEMLRR
jgi:hypothetical protein